jgi:ATP-dependent helicase/nuclease subunit B
MGASAELEIDAWLRQGRIVVTASERAARALSNAFHRDRRAQGLKAWPAPNIADWNSFVRSAWLDRNFDGRLILNSTQEQSLWARLAAADTRMAALLEGPRYRLADLAMEAHEMLCGYEPRLLKTSARAAWQNDAAAFSRWLAAFNETCRTENLISPTRLPIELIQLLQNRSKEGDPERPALLLAGFDRILPVQRAVLDAWGHWQEAALNQTASEVFFHEARDDQEELKACALWCGSKLRKNPEARILVVTQDARARRGEIERAFLANAGPNGTGPAASPLFEFSLGVPLSTVALARAALLLLRWLSGSLAEHEIDWLFSTGHAAADAHESLALQNHMRALRRCSLEQPSWTMQRFLAPAANDPRVKPLPLSFVERINRASQRLAEAERRSQSALDWAETIPKLLEDAGWPGYHLLSSAEFQTAHRWQQALETTGSLGFDGRAMGSKDFLSVLARTLEETLFAPESRDAPIQIAGSAESAGLTADAIWFLGATEDAWPASGATHPLLPPEVQREARMPHATPQLDWELAQRITTRLLASAPEVQFSYAKQIAGAESRPSRLIAQLATAPNPMPAEFTTASRLDASTIAFKDFSRIPYPPGGVAGGASVLTAQSQCPFKAFAIARLDAQSWEPAEAGLTATRRGKLLHSVLHAVWSGPPDGIRSLEELVGLGDKQTWGYAHVRRVFRDEVGPDLRDRMPPRYLELEQERLSRLVTQWLEYEAARAPFEVLETEARKEITLAGLTFKVRLDRLDQLNDGSVLVIDYKSGDVKPKSWELPRPEDVQLPLYAGFALEQDLGGLVFAKVRPGALEFAGCVGAPAATLLPGLKNTSSLSKNCLTGEQLMNWRDSIEQLAKDFLEGKAEVDPRDPPKTCEQCGLQTLCRIQENEISVDAEDDDEEAIDE